MYKRHVGIHVYTYIHIERDVHTYMYICRQICMYTYVYAEMVFGARCKTAKLNI